MKRSMKRNLRWAGLVLAAAVQSSASAAPWASTAGEQLQLKLPTFASDPVELVDLESGVGVAVTPVGALRVRAEQLDAGLSFANVFGDAHMLIAAQPGGFEDTTYLQTRPAEERARYQLKLQNVVGLRLFDNVLELLDAQGTPRLRMNRPWIRDRFGEVHGLTVKLSGCTFDTSPLPPWRRPTVPPGSNACELMLDWSELELEYPAELDPSWTLTGATELRFSAALCADKQGHAILAGGDTLSAFPSTSAEMFDLATRTWTPIAPTYRAHHAPTCVTLADDRVMVSGGTNVTPIKSVDIYDPETGAWSSRDMVEARSKHTLTLLADGRVLAAGGFSGSIPLYSSAEIFDPAADTWTLIDPLDAVRFGHGAALLADGRVLIAGGNQSGAPTAELLDPATLTWSPAANMPTPREGFPLVTVDGRVLAVGGGYNATTKGWVDEYDPLTDTWIQRLSLPYPLEDHHALPLPSGRVLLFGGSHDLGILDETFAYEWSLDAWLSAGPGTLRTESLAAVLSDGSLLTVTGHLNQGDPIPLNALLFVESTLGEACEAAGACETSYCTDGFCCEDDCSSTCERCTATGACVDVTSGPDPDTCSDDLACNANSECKKADGRDCLDKDACASGHCVDGVCCDKACESSCEACDGVTPGACEFVVGVPHGEREGCPEGTVCDGTDAECVGLSLCQDEHFVVQPDGSLRDCTPYVCAAEGSCLQTCGSLLDCAAPFVCDTLGECVLPTFEQPSAGCAVSQPRAEGPWGLAVLLGVGTWARRGRRIRR
jgi:hypothetical protein